MASPVLVREFPDAPPRLLRELARDCARYPVLLDSVSDGALARWEILAATPRESIVLEPGGCVTSADAGAVARAGAGGFLGALDRAWRAARSPAFERPAGLPFAGGWFVYLGYELAAEIEPRLVLPTCGDPCVAYALRVPAAVLRDCRGGRCLVVAEPGAEAEFDSIVADVERSLAQGPASLPPGMRAAPVVVEEPEALFLARVQRIQDAIGAGEVYQANLSRAWRARVGEDCEPLALYERLREANPAPFGALARFGGMSVLSSSPERLLRIEAGRVSTRPIAGTRPRSAARDRDASEAAALVAHPKERAEHIMLIDLERNDLGRVCTAGSVVVEEFMAVETYAHVHHIVSAVAGQLRPGLSPVDALRAVFPGGTITGCPKVRCMQLLAAQEAEGRGAYTGSLGYIGHDGSADFNILIRTITLRAGEALLRAGAGIVADSDPRRELEETRAKARGMLAALEARP